MANDRSTTATPRIARPRIPKLALTVREAGEALGLSHRSVQDLIAAQALPIVRCGRRVLIPVEGLRAWLRQQTIQPPSSEQTRQ